MVAADTALRRRSASIGCELRHHPEAARICDRDKRIAEIRAGSIGRPSSRSAGSRLGERANVDTSPELTRKEVSMPEQHRLHLDRTGFPMVWREEVAAYVHWVPVTKVQFEYFICDAPDAHFDSTWYDEILDLNPRVTPGEVSVGNYWRSFLTGLRPSEAQRFASWSGDGYRLPTDSEWSTLYGRLRAQPAETLSTLERLDTPNQRARTLLERFSHVAQASLQGQAPSLASQMLFRFGALEWVQVGRPPAAWGLRGEPLPAFCGNLEVLDRPAEPLGATESTRYAAAGFRLLYNPPSAQPEDIPAEPARG